MKTISVMFNYNHLYYFYVTAKLKGVTLAARQLNTSQPSLSTQIKTLESNLKVELFHKRGRTIELTHKGRQVYNYCHRMFAVSEELSSFLLDGSLSPNTHIRIGISQELERPFVAKIITKALSQNASVSVSTYSRPDGEMQNLLKMRELDLLISNTPFYDDEVKVLASFELPVALVAAPNLAKDLGLSKRKSLDENLKKASQKLVLPSPNLKLRQEIDRFLLDRGIKGRMLFESDMLASVVKIIAEGFAIGFVPIPYIRNELSTGVLQIYPSSNENLWTQKISLMSISDLNSDNFVDRLVTQIESMRI